MVSSLSALPRKVMVEVPQEKAALLPVEPRKCVEAARAVNDDNPLIF
jgi:hypothetical protein